MSSELAPQSSCLDAETIAAWSEGSLSPAEAAEVELHLSNCARCQAILATFARTEPATPAVLPFRPRLSGAWLVPLAAAAAVVLWVAVARREDAVGPTQMAARVETPAVAPDASIGAPVPAPVPVLQAPAPRPAEAARAAKLDSSRVQLSKPSPPAATSAADAPLPPTARPPQSGTERRGVANNTAGQPRLGGGGRGDVIIDAVAPVGTRPSPAPAPPPPPAPAQAPPPPASPLPSAAGAIPADPSRPVSDATISQGQTAISSTTGERSFDVLAMRVARPVIEIVSAIPAGSLAAPPAGGGGGARGGGRGIGGGVGGGRGGQAPGVVPTRWRILGPARGERSTDGGVSWSAITIDPPAAVTAGTSPSSTVCWLIGPGGTVLLTTDGLHFNRVGFPETSDLSSIRAIDALHATVTTTTGRVLTTSDGGLSWLQGFPPTPF